MDKQHIISEIKRTAEANGGIPLGTERFRSETGIRRSDWLGKYWARWGDALKEAGYKPNTLQGAYEDDRIIEKIISLIRELGRFPVAAEVKLKGRQDKDFPSHNTVFKSGKAALAAKIIMYCADKTEFDDIFAICKPIVHIAPQRQSNTLDHASIDGHVYLLKSGRYYKIGRTNAVGRREYELSIQLPDKATKIHVIKTDDPVGIEAYWHKRFQDRRKNSEWFELTTEDIKAFKRRKFM